MIRKAFRMSVNPGQEAEYARRHNPIWAELDEVLRRHGVQRYSIFLDPTTNDLFAYAEIESDERWAAIAGTDVCRRWWRSEWSVHFNASRDGTLLRATAAGRRTWPRPATVNGSICSVRSSFRTAPIMRFRTPTTSSRPAS